MRTQSVFQKSLVFLLVFVLMAVVVLPVRAATDVTGLADGNITLSYETTEGTVRDKYTRQTNVSASWSATGTTITGSITPGRSYRTIGITYYYPDTSAKTVLTITNGYSDQRLLTFSYTEPGNGGSISFTGIDTYGNGSVTALVDAGASVTVTVTTASSTNRGDAATKYTTGTTLTNVKFTVLKSDPDITLTEAGISGSYTAKANGTSIAVGETHTLSKDTVYSFAATPAANYQFEGWYFNDLKYSTAEAISGIKFDVDTEVEARFVYDPLFSVAKTGENLEGSIGDYIQVDSIYYHNLTGSRHTTRGDTDTNNSYGPPVYFPNSQWSASSGTIVSSAQGTSQGDNQTETGRSNARAWLYSDIIRVKCLKNCILSFDATVKASSVNSVDDIPTAGVYFYYWATDNASATAAKITANGEPLISGSKSSNKSGSSGEISLNAGQYLYLYSYAETLKSDTNLTGLWATSATDNYSYTSTVSNFTISPASATSTLTIGNYTNTGDLLQSGSVLVNGTNMSLTSANYSAESQNGTVYTLKPGTAPSGYVFIGWDINGTPVYTSAEYSLTLAENTTVKALYVPAMTITAGGENGYGSATYKLGSSTYNTGSNPYYVARNADCTAFYTDLNAAFAGTDTVVLLAGHTVNGDMTIPAGKTLVIPYGHADNGITNGSPDQTATYSTTTNYCLVNYNGNLTVNGTLLVNGLQSGYSNYSGRPSGGIGCLKLSNSSVVTLNGTLYAYGHIRGGQINAAAGAAVHELLEFGDMRSVLVMNEIVDKKGTYKVMPASHISLESIESTVTYSLGSTLYGHFSALLAGMNETTYNASVVIGQNQGWMQMSSGTLTKSYDFTQNQAVYRIDKDSAATTGGVTCTFHYEYAEQSKTVELASKDYYFPLDQSFCIEVAGNLTFASDHKFLPGARLVVDEGGVCTVAQGTDVVLYRLNDYDTRSPGSNTNYQGYSQVAYPVLNLNYPLGGYAAKKTLATVGSASLTVNGTMNVLGGLFVTDDLVSASSQGIADTTDADGNTVKRAEVNAAYFTKYANGYNILKGSGTGIIDMSGATSNTTSIYEAMVASGTNAPHYDAIVVTPVKGLPVGTSVDAPENYSVLSGDVFYGYENGSTSTWYTNEVTLKQGENTLYTIRAFSNVDLLSSGVIYDASGAVVAQITDPTVAQCTVFNGWSADGTAEGAVTTEALLSTAFSAHGEKAVLYAVCTEAHAYGEAPVFTWADDYSCTAAFVCGNGCGKNIGLTVDVESNITLEPKCDAEGVRLYTATTTETNSEGNPYTDTKEQVIEKLPHTYNEDHVTFAWTDNSCKASYTCTVCQTLGEADCHVDSDTTEPTCTAAGQTVYTASITLNGQTYTDTKTVVLDQLAHQYTAPTFAWSEDYSTCQAAYTCSVGGESHTVDCAVSTATTNASCTAPGKTTYTASVEIAGTAYSDVKKVEIPQLTHSFTSYTHKDDATCTTKATEIASCDHGCGTTDIRQVGEVLGHSYTNYVSNGNATCTADGTKTATCDNGCGTKDTVTDVDSKLGHKYTDYTYNNNATCQKDGTKTASCDYGCGAQSTVTAEGTKIDHVFGDYVSNNDVTCTTAGTKTRTCTFGCGTTETATDENAPALKHSFTNYISNEDATCLANGTETAKCDRCDVTKTREDAESALGHSFTNYVPNTDAVCGKDGTKTAKCDRCEVTNTVTNEGSALSHSFTEYVSDNNATCLQNCTKTAYCDHECGVTDTREIAGTKLEHVYTNYVSNNDATCLEDGTETATCDLNCGTTSTRTDEGSTLGHSFTNYVSDGNATCITDGTKTAKCDRCDVTDTIADVGSVLGHAYGEYTSNGDATCTADGTKTAECSRCHEKDTVTDEGSKLDHSFTEYVSDNNATCTKDGTETAKCGNCDATDTRIVENSTVDHRYTTYVSNEDATCKADGTKTAECDYGCGSKNTIADEGSKLPHTEVIDAAMEATCTATGLTEGKHCSVCGEVIVKQKVVEMKPHSYDAVVTAPTCTAGGYTTYTCSVCGTEHIGDNTDALGHTNAEAVVENTVAATCTDDGSYDNVVYCSVCGFQVSRDTITVPATGHTDAAAVVENEVAATCGADGSYDSVIYCSVCRVEVKRDTVVLPATGAHTYTTETERVNATCTADGYVVKTCTCGATEKTVLTKTGHTAGSAATENAVAATCTSDGSYDTVVYCATCGVELSRVSTTVPATGHKYDSVVTDPTCTEDGVKTFTCSVCGDSYTEVILATGHVNTTTTTVDATCTEAGSMTVTCDDCGEVVSTEVIKSEGHKYDSVVTAPTCTTAGYTTYTCSSCGHSYVDDEMTAIDHSYDAVVTAPTCVDAGYTTYTCSDCGDTYTADETPATGVHTYVDGICSDCDAEEPIELFYIDGANMTLGGSLAINFFIEPTDLEDGETYYAVITKEYADGRDDVVETIQQADWSWHTGYNQYYVSFNRVAAKEMSDEITVVVYNSKNEAVSYEWVDSVRNYTMRMLRKEEAKSSPSAEKLALYVDMLNYGAAAQDYFDDYNIDDLANNQVTEHQQAYSTADVTMADNRIKGEGYSASNLKLESEIIMNIFFLGSHVDQSMYAIVTFTDHYGNEKSTRVEGSEFGQLNNDTDWYVPVKGLAVADCRQLVTITVYDGYNNQVATGTDSIESYVARKANAAALFTAIMKFGTSAYAYFH